MAGSGFFDRDDSGAQIAYGRKLSSPMSIFGRWSSSSFWSALRARFSYRQAHNAFVANPGLNGLIIGVLLIGILLAFNHVISLRPEVRWFNSFRAAGQHRESWPRARDAGADAGADLVEPDGCAVDHGAALDPRFDRFAPRRDTRYDPRISPACWCSSACSARSGVCLAPSARSTPSSKGSIRKRRDGGYSQSTLKESLSAPLAGHGDGLFDIAVRPCRLADPRLPRPASGPRRRTDSITSSKTGCRRSPTCRAILPWHRSSIVFRRLVGRAARRCRNNWCGLPRKAAARQRSTAAMANLAEGIQGLVRNMRTEQQMLRDWIEAQQEESKALRRTLDRLTDKIEEAADGWRVAAAAGSGRSTIGRGLSMRSRRSCCRSCSC
jgi:hypothetical protein